MSSVLPIQSYIAPVCTYEDDGDGSKLNRLVGTAFFFSYEGHFMTAGHVIKQCMAMATGKTKFGIMVPDLAKEENASVIFPLSETMIDFAPHPHDIAVGKLEYYIDCPLTLGDIDGLIWQNVATAGYPTTAVTNVVGGFWANTRGQKGYIQRKTLPRDMPIGEHPEGYELSFLLGNGMSGCPIFADGDHRVFGVGVSTIESSIEVSSISEIDKNGGVYCEKVMKVEQFGFAHRIRDIMGWRPSIYAGLSLLEISQSHTKPSSLKI